MASWDRRTPEAQGKVRDAAIRAQMRDCVGPFSPFWRERLAALRKPAGSVRSAGDLAMLPAVSERDVCPDGDPRSAARLVLQADESGWALHTQGPALRQALVRRLRGTAAYRRQVEADVRPTTYHFAGAALTFPVASTRRDLDLVARAGARAWQVLGLSGADVLVSAVPVAQRLDHVFLSFAALAAGAPALFPRADGAGVDGVVTALGTVSATVLAVPADGGAALLEDLAAAGAALDDVQAVLVVGSTGADDEVRAAAAAAGLDRARVLGLYGPDAGRVLWAQCAPGSGFHTYPDLDVVELVDPDSGEAAPRGEGGEVVVTQLGFRGSALVRWRTGDVVDEPLESGACRGCGRTVPRVAPPVRRGSLVHQLELRGGAATLDVRAVAGALNGRADVAGWRVETVTSARDGARDLLVYVAANGDEADAAVGAYRDVLAASGVAPAQVVVVTADEIAAAGDRPRVDLRR